MKLFKTWVQIPPAPKLNNHFMITDNILEEFFNTTDLNIRTPLCEIMSKFGSDKGNDTHHNYTRLYNYIFSAYREKPINLFEVGLGTNNLNVQSNMGLEGKPGASLYGWREYFFNANIYGADIDKNILFDSKNIKTFFIDQLNTETIKVLFDQTLKDIEFDIIIDDGLHTFEANSNFFH